MKPTARRSLTGASGSDSVQSGWRVGRPGRRRSLPEPLEHPGWQLRPGAGMCLTRAGRGGFSLQFSVGSLWAQRPGCAGAPSQLESSGGAEWFQSSPGTGIVERCPPPPRRTARSYPAAGARAAARGLGLLPPPPPPPRGRCSPRAGCALRVLPRRPPARLPGSAPSFPFSPSHRHLLASTPSCYLQSSPDPRAPRCREVSLGQRISGQRIWSIRVRIAAAAAARRPREGAPGTPSAAAEAQRRPGLGGSRLVASSCFSPPPPAPRARNPLLVRRGGSCDARELPADLTVSIFRCKFRRGGRKILECLC